MRRQLLPATALLGAAVLVPGAGAQAPQKVSKSVPTSSTAASGATSGASNGARNGATNGAAESGAFVVRLGADTVAAEQWTRTPGANGARLEGDVFNRAPIARVTHYVVDLDAGGRPTRAEITTRRPDGTPMPNQSRNTVYTFRGDSAFAELQMPDSVARVRAAAPAGTFPNVANSYALWESAVRAVRAAGSDSGAIRLWGGGPQVQTLPVRVRNAQETTVTYFGDPVAMHFDPAGRLVHVDGSRSTNKQEVERTASVDVAAIASRYGAQPAMGQASPRDTTRATVGAAQLLVDYGRPSVRGRTVWGGVLVPKNAIWRTGANAATTFVTSRDLTIGGKAVPAGTYTLYTWASDQGTYELVVNRQTGQWGTDYKQEMDLVRIPLTATPLSAPVEQFTIAIEPAGANGGSFVMRWGTQQLAVPFTVK
jgi:hypothetical protein